MNTSKRFAFFDFDQTILNFKTLIVFEEYWLAHQSSKKQTKEERDFLENRKRFIHETLRQIPRRQANLLFFKGFKGRSEKGLSLLINQWFETLKESNKDYYNEAVVSKLEQLRKDNVEPVFVSGSYVKLISKFAIELNVKHLLATRLKIKSGIYTGEIIGKNPIIGEGKRIAVESFLQNYKVSPLDCIAVGDHISDAPMLQCVGNSFIVKGDKQLENLAKKHSWEII